MVQVGRFQLVPRWRNMAISWYSHVYTCSTVTVNWGNLGYKFSAVSLTLHCMKAVRWRKNSLHKEVRGDSVNTRLISTWLWNREYSGIKVLHMISSQEVLKGLFETYVLGEIEVTSISHNSTIVAFKVCTLWFWCQSVLNTPHNSGVRPKQVHAMIHLIQLGRGQ